MEIIPADAVQAADTVRHFSLSYFMPPDLCLPEVEMPATSSAEQLEGIALHALLERLSHQNATWPITVPEAAIVAAWLPCSLAIASSICGQAKQILENPALARFFDTQQFQFARNEMDIVYQQQLCRVDRLVAFADTVWILDYKRQLLASEQQDYAAQLASYRAAVGAVYPDRAVRSALILASGEMIEM
jgi:ATP-dependent helicase/nuclease subunit A